MPKRTKPNRAAFDKLLRQNAGKHIHITALLLELGRAQVYVTRDTARNWLIAAGCELKATGVYLVPDKKPTSSNESSEAIA